MHKYNFIKIAEEVVCSLDYFWDILDKIGSSVDKKIDKNKLINVFMVQLDDAYKQYKKSIIENPKFHGHPEANKNPINQEAWRAIYEGNKANNNLRVSLIENKTTAKWASNNGYKPEKRPLQIQYEAEHIIQILAVCLGAFFAWFEFGIGNKDFEVDDNEISTLHNHSINYIPSKFLPIYKIGISSIKTEIQGIIKENAGLDEKHLDLLKKVASNF